MPAFYTPFAWVRGVDIAYMYNVYYYNMLRINIYIPEDMNKQLDFTAKSRHKAKAEVIREALNHGLKVIQPKSGNAQALLDLAKMAEKIPTVGNMPKDFSKNLDHYTWGGEKRG